MWPGMAARFAEYFWLSIYSVANVLLADLTQFLLDSLGEASQISMGFVSAAAPGSGRRVTKGLLSMRASLYPPRQLSVR